MPLNPTDHAAALRAAILAIPQECRSYVLNFVVKNVHKTEADLLTHMARDLAARAEAENLERHRREKVLADAAEITGKSIETLLEGQASGAVQGEPGKKKGK